MPYTDIAIARTTAKRAAGATNETFWADVDWDDELTHTAKTIDSVAYFQPFEVAARYIVNPLRVTAQTVGTLSDTYLDPFKVAQDLRERQATDNLALPTPTDGGTSGGGPDDCLATFGGW